MTKKLFKSRNLLTSIISILITASIFALGSGVDEASAAKCVGYKAKIKDQNYFAAWTTSRRIPSDCPYYQNIYITDIHIPKTDVVCGDFVVRMYKNNGKIEFGKLIRACSFPSPSGKKPQPTLLAVNVIKGTKYDVISSWTVGYKDIPHSFRIVY